MKGFLYYIIYTFIAAGVRLGIATEGATWKTFVVALWGGDGFYILSLVLGIILNPFLVLSFVSVICCDLSLLLFLLLLILKLRLHLLIMQIPSPLTLILRPKPQRLRAQKILKIIRFLRIQIHLLTLRHPKQINHPSQPHRRRRELPKILDPLRLIHQGLLALPPGTIDHDVALAGAHAPEYFKGVDVGVLEVGGWDCAVLGDEVGDLRIDP